MKRPNAQLEGNGKTLEESTSLDTTANSGRIRDFLNGHLPTILLLLRTVHQNDQRNVVEKGHCQKSDLDAAIAGDIAITQMVKLATMRMGYSMPKEWR